jgi:hypothetical protein
VIGPSRKIASSPSAVTTPSSNCNVPSISDTAGPIPSNASVPFSIASDASRRYADMSSNGSSSASSTWPSPAGAITRS